MAHVYAHYNSATGETGFGGSIDEALFRSFIPSYIKGAKPQPPTTEPRPATDPSLRIAQALASQREKTGFAPGQVVYFPKLDDNKPKTD